MRSCLGRVESVPLLIAITLVGFLISACTHSRPTGMFPQGKEWLSWDETTKALYVRGLVDGIMQGFARGCEAAIHTSIPPLNGQDFVGAMNRCYFRDPLSFQDSTKLIPQITEFYRVFPQQRQLFVSQIFLELHAGHTIDQVNQNFSARP